MLVEIVTTLLVVTTVFLTFLFTTFLIQFHGYIVAGKQVKANVTFHVWSIAICSGLIFYSVMYLG